MNAAKGIQKSECGVPRKVGKMKRQAVNTDFTLVLSLVAASCLTTGCSSMSKYSFFSWGNEPSPEALASAGPQVTYPAPPSANSTPKSIASVAGGTSEADVDIPDLDFDEGQITTQQFAASEQLPDYANPGANMAAAQANGYSTPKVNPIGSVASTRSEAVNDLSNSTFGEPAFTPKTASVSDATFGATASLPGTGQTSNRSTSSLNHGFAPPANSNTSAPSDSGIIANGFALPTDSPSLANLKPSEEKTGTVTDQAEIGGSLSSPEYSTANASSVYSTTVSDRVLPSEEELNSKQGEPGYSPGSTSSGLSYPTTGGSAPTTSGTYFR